VTGLTISASFSSLSLFLLRVALGLLASLFLGFHLGLAT